MLNLEEFIQQALDSRTEARDCGKTSARRADNARKMGPAIKVYAYHETVQLVTPAIYSQGRSERNYYLDLKNVTIGTRRTERTRRANSTK
jgi:hypothetical protein